MKARGRDRAEQIVCFADLFYSKKPGKLGVRKSAALVRKKLLPFGVEKVAIFDAWLAQFRYADPEGVIAASGTP